MWWLSNHPGEVEAAVELLDTLTDLSAAANDLPVRDPAIKPSTREQSPHVELASTPDQLPVTSHASPPADVPPNGTAFEQAGHAAAGTDTAAQAHTASDPAYRERFCTE
ncbi:hypothetical protein [Kribbella sp. NPDC048915]|uniref:hypothetical protein n=1 Tax=Kribbella sp. NPDC048915 TaxID=3155148 RepID=UPI0033FA8868